MAQLVEHIVHIDGVTGSSPVGTTKQKTTQLGGFFVCVREAFEPMSPAM